MIKLIKSIKLKFPQIWHVIEILNGFIILLLWKDKYSRAVDAITAYKVSNGITFKQCKIKDLSTLYSTLNTISEDDKKYFRPFPFTGKSLRNILSTATYQVFLAYEGTSVCGMFFLRLFFNKKCFLGFWVMGDHRGCGIGRDMIRAMNNASKILGFSLMSTVNSDNTASLHAHFSAAPFHVVETLPDGDLVLRIKDKYSC